MEMSNRWNRFIYRLWAPIYDFTVNRLFAPGRKRAIEVLVLKPGEKVLIAGIVTGACLFCRQEWKSLEPISVRPCWRRPDKRLLSVRRL